MKSAVLFIIFNRAETTQQVFERIREVKPPKLYIAADGPRDTKTGEAEKCERTRNVVEEIDWPCEVHRMYQKKNLGCGKGVSSALTWFFSHEEQGIIIEDDILPHPDFFRYCDEMLDRYKTDDSIHIISGFNTFYQGYPSDISYYKSNGMQIWGWASWRRVWETYEYDLKKVSRKKLKKNLYNRLPRQNAHYILNLYDYMVKVGCDTWDYQFLINQFMFNRYSIVCYKNLTQNIGIGIEDATHTTSVNSLISKHIAASPYPLNHPNPLQTDMNADIVLMRNGGMIAPSFAKRLYNKFSRVLKKLF